jgi:hypothetical protein
VSSDQHQTKGTTRLESTDGPYVVRWGRLDCVSRSKEQSMKKPKTQVGLPGTSPLRSDGSHVTQVGRMGCVSSGQIRLKQSVKTTLDSQETYETGKVVAQLKRVNLIFIWEC